MSGSKMFPVFESFWIPTLFRTTLYLLFQVDFIGPREPLKEAGVRNVWRSDLTRRKRWTLTVTLKIFAIGGLKKKKGSRLVLYVALI